MRRCVVLFVGLAIAFSWQAADAKPRATAPPEKPLYKPVADHVFQQEVGRKVPTEKPVTALAAWQGEIYAVLDGTLHRLEGSKLKAVKSSPAGLRRLVALNGQLWGTTADALYQFEEGAGSAKKVFEGEVVDLCLHNGAVHAATAK